MMKTCLFAALLAASTVLAAAAQDRCAELAAIQLPDVRITNASHVQATAAQYASTAHCKVDGVIGREIRFEVLLPEDWNGRFVMGGGGGFVGSVQNSARYTIDRGYATAGTDTGHDAPGTSGAWALYNPERQVNFGHLAVHRTAEVAKAIIRTYYDGAPEYSYFMGCSRGGGQALMEAQRYPGDFDGIVAGAPAHDWTGFGAEGIRNLQKAFPDPGKTDVPAVPLGHLQYLERAVLDKCDEIDGVDDGVMTDPRACTFDLSSLPSCDGGTDGLCFTDEQIEVIREVYAPPSKHDGPFFVGQPFGGEGDPWGWKNWITGILDDPVQTAARRIPSLHYGFAIDIYRYFVFNDPDWDYRTYDFSTWEDDVRYAGAILNATNPDLSEFEAEGGKLIVWHGWSDAALSALASIDYYEEVEDLDPGLRDYFRMYLMPGVLHCGGGPGPDQVDWLTAITDWVEEGRAPERITAAKTGQEGDVLMTRPLCPYPQRAVYDESGAPEDAGSFTCEAPE